jgi:hypothetical protein
MPLPKPPNPRQATQRPCCRTASEGEQVITKSSLDVEMGLEIGLELICHRHDRQAGRRWLGE